MMRCGPARWIALGAATLCICGCCSLQGGWTFATNSPAKKYAVLASVGDPKIDGEAYHSEFWYDTVIVYRALLKLGYAPENVLVLYAKGKDFSSSVPGYGATSPPIVDFPLNLPPNAFDSYAEKNNIAHVLCCLATGCVSRFKGPECTCSRYSRSSDDGISCAGIPRLRPRDSLFVWLKGHAETTNCEDTRMKFDRGPYLKETELADMLSRLRTNHRVLTMETCRAGGFLDSVASEHDEGLRSTVAMASTGDPLPDPGQTDPYLCNQGSYSSSFRENGIEIVHGRFSYWLNQALTDATTADADGNALASASEVFEYVREAVEGENIGDGNRMKPGIRDHTHVAPCTFLATPRPGSDVELYFRSATSRQSQCPDLEIVRFESARPQEALGRWTDYTLRATVHNAGCGTARSVIVSFFVRPLDAGDGAFVEVGAAQIASIGRTATGVASVRWQTRNTGAHVVEARVFAPAGEASPANSRDTADKHKCRLTVTVPRP